MNDDIKMFLGYVEPHNKFGIECDICLCIFFSNNVTTLSCKSGLDDPATIRVKSNE